MPDDIVVSCKTSAPPDPYVFKLNQKTEWKTIGNLPFQFEGRIFSGCIDTIRHLAETAFGDVRAFRGKFIMGDKIIWALENCDMDVPGFYLAILQLHNAGWFDYTGIPIVYDVDIGHVPPQMTFVNGAFAEVEVAEGEASMKMSFV